MDKPSAIFDITTLFGARNAAEAMTRGFAYTTVYPSVFIITKAVQAIQKLVSVDSTIEQQRKTAIDIIKAGRESNVSSVEIVLDQKAGIDIGSEVQGLPVKIMLGQSGKMTIRVDYGQPADVVSANANT